MKTDSIESGAFIRGPAAKVLRWALLGLALLSLICVPYSLPPVGGTSLPGWSATNVRPDGTPIFVVTGTMRHAAAAGLMTGDVIVSINGVPADSVVVNRALSSARPGDTLTLGTLRHGGPRVVHAPVLHNPASLSAFFGIRLVIAAFAWLVATLALLLRPGARWTYPLAGALLLIAPATFPAGVPGDAVWSVPIRWTWQMMATVYRFAFPVLLAHVFVLALPIKRLERNHRLWIGAYLALILLAAASTGAFTTPLAWTQDGFARDVRLYSGVVLRAVALVVALHVRIRSPVAPRQLRWFADAVGANMAVSVIAGALVLVGADMFVQVFSQLHAMLLAVVPATAGMLLVAGPSTPGTAQERKTLGSTLIAGLSALYGCSVAGVAAVVLASANRSLDGLEWLLFLAIFLAAVTLSPVLLWGRELVDRRVFARWIAMEHRVANVLDQVGVELEPERIVRRLIAELPAAVSASRVRLLLAESWVARLALSDAAPVEPVEDAVLKEQSGATPGDPGIALLPIQDRWGNVIGALRIERAEGGPAFASADGGWQRMLALGVAALLRTADTFQQLRLAQDELAASERNAMVGAMAAELANEIKNPLASLRIGLHLLEQEGVDPTRLHRILLDLQRIDDLVAALLRHSDAADQEIDTIDLGELLHEVLKSLQPLVSHRKARLFVRMPGQPIRVRADRNALRLALSKLLRYSLDAVEDGDVIEVRVDRDARGAQFVVRDTAPRHAGVERHPKVTLPRAPNGDGGLALALARREIEHLGGALEVDESRTIGTTMRVSLPSVP